MKHFLAHTVLRTYVLHTSCSLYTVQGPWKVWKPKGAPSSDAASGWAGWALAHPTFASSVIPITIRRADYAHHITDSPPGFQNPAASLPSNVVGIVYPLGGGAAPPPTPISDSPTVVCRLGVGVGTLLKISFQCYNSKGWNANPQVKRADHFDIWHFLGKARCISYLPKRSSIYYVSKKTGGVGGWMDGWMGLENVQFCWRSVLYSCMQPS